MTRENVPTFAATPDGNLYAVRGDRNAQRYDGLGSFTDAGITAPSTKPVIASSGSGDIVGSLYCYVRYLDASGRVSNLSPISAVHTVSISTGSITNATNASPIRITSAGHGLSSTDTVKITGVLGNTGANGTWTVTVVDSNRFDLDTSVGTGSYQSGGTWREGAGQINYSSIQDATTDSRVTRKQILRNKDGSVNVFYVDLDTDVDAGFALASTTATSTKLEANLGTEVALFDDNGNVLGNVRHSEPPNWKRVGVHHYSRMWYLVDAPYRQGAVAVTNGSTTVTGIGTNWTSAMAGWIFYPDGTSNTTSYTVSSVNTGAQTLTLSSNYGGSTAAFINYSLEKGGNEPRTIYYSEVDLPESVNLNNGLTVTEDDDAGDLVGAMPYQSVLYLLFENRIRRLSYLTDPKTDGDSVLAEWRGCVNQNCWVLVERVAYLLDRKGVYIFGGNHFEAVSRQIQSLFDTNTESSLKIRWEWKENFHSVHDPSTETIRWFVCLDGARYPHHALCLHYRTGSWWVEDFGRAITSSTLGKLNGRPQVFLGSTNRQVLALNRGTLDGIGPDAGTLRGTVTSGGLTSLTDSAAAFTASVVGCPVQITTGTGKGQVRFVAAQTATVLTVTQPWSVKPDTTSVYQVGGIRYTYRTGIFRYAQTGRQEQRGFEVVWSPTIAASRLALRRFHDHSTTAVNESVTRSQNGVSTTDGAPEIVVDTTKGSGYVKHDTDSFRGNDVDGVRFVSVEVSGVPNTERHIIRELHVHGAQE